MQYHNEFASVFSSFPTKITGARTAQRHVITCTARLQTLQNDQQSGSQVAREQKYFFSKMLK